MTGVLKEAGIDPVYTTKAKKAKLAFKLNAVPSNNNDEAYRLAVMSPDSKKQIVATRPTPVRGCSMRCRRCAR